MQSLAAPTVGIAHGEEVLRFTRLPPEGTAADPEGAGLGYAAEVAPLATAAERPHESLFETGPKLALIPERLYRFEDRRDYLLGAYPNVSAEVGVVDVPSVGALGIFERDARVPSGADAGHHVVQLFVGTADELRTRHPDFAIAFFTGPHLWVVLYRGGQLAAVEGRGSRASADAVFHLASRYEHFGLDRAAVPLFLAGAVAPDGELDRQLRIYFSVAYLREALPPANRGPAARLLLAYGRAVRDRAGAIDSTTA